MWSVIGIEHITIVLWLALITLLFGNWQHVHPELPKDIAVIIYVGGICTFLPIVLINFMQRYIPPLEVAFISILEPVWGVIIAHLYLEEVVPHSLYLGGALILAAALLHIWSTAWQKDRDQESSTSRLFWETIPSGVVKSIIKMELSLER